MRLSNFLFKSSVAIVLLLIGRTLFFRSTLTPTDALKKIESHNFAVIKSAQLALEKSSSSFLRDTAQHLLDELTHEKEQLQELYRDENHLVSDISSEMEALTFTYDYDEESPFDLAYASHQLGECKKILAILQRATHVPQSNVKDIALRNISIFSHYQSRPNQFKENFLSIDEYRIRDIAHQIWESEGRPEGEEKRHWGLAVELLNGISLADRQLAFEQKRSLIDIFSTTPNAFMQKPH